MKRAYFAGGCFWCMTPVFREAGADRVVCGYSGGEEEDPVYEDVKAQRTGHRETILLEYDPAKVSYGRLLDIYFENVDPFDAGGQFIDRGHSYTLAVYWSSEEEKALAEERIRKLEQESGRTVCVALEPFARFYDAEEYHQDYDLKNPEAFERELIESGRKSADG
ncbi:MAG: peptide-methionine (S)-S-oxide reductase MsrA [Oscillospiraceae bacterium]|nr:peptide-methionine (S)-S-oxide reductase MsrA [Oscillospiraceae bacterium]